jgi:hypothetical protein
MKVMKLQDELEASGKTQAEIDSELARYRQKLMIRMDQKLGAKNDNNNSRKESNEKGKESGGMRGNRRSSDEDKNKKERHRDGKEELRERHHREGSEERTRRKDDTRDNKGRHQRDRERNRSRERPRSKNRNQSREDRGRGDKYFIGTLPTYTQCLLPFVLEEDIQEVRTDAVDNGHRAQFLKLYSNFNFLFPNKHKDKFCIDITFRSISFMFQIQHWC